MITTRVLENESEIEDACAILYKVYIEQLNWQFEKDNPSELKTIIKNEKNLLVDRFTNNAIWFGVFDGKKLMGCARLCGLDENGKYEVEGYPNSKVIHNHLPRNNCFEMGKVAVLDEYKGKRAVHLLYLTAFEYGERNKSSIFGCVSNPYIKSIFNKIGLPLKMEQAFKYEENDSPVNFYFIDYQKGDFKHVIDNLKKFRLNLVTKQFSIFDALEMVAQIFPAPMYWHDVNGVVLGINEHCLKGMGTTREKVIGKTPYDFHPKHIAEHILKHNEMIMRSGEVGGQEESFNQLTTGEKVYAKAIKAPLYDEYGKVIGIVGTSIDITAEKKAAQLEIENQTYQTEKKSQEKFKKLIDNMNNLIQSFKIEHLNQQIGSKLPIKEVKEITLTKREKEVTYYLSLNKSPKDIAAILSIIENKDIAPSTIQAIIDKQLYPKLDVYNTSQLIDKAHLLKLIPFIPENT